MAAEDLDVVGIGNAIVDVIAHAGDGFLAAEGLVKGSMTLIDAARASALYDAMEPAVEMSGGSAANTIAGVASFGGKAGFIGKVKDDQLGAVFRHDIKALGVAFDTSLAKDGPPTARCLILVTPDAQRTMNTYLGACAELGPDDVDPALIAKAKVTYLEGYLWDPPLAKEAFRKAIGLAHAAGRKVALTLSDSFCVERFRAEFRDLVKREVDILFANEAEIRSLYEARDFDEALQLARADCGFVALTRSEKGSVVVSNSEVHVIDAERAKVVDTTGAGDMYAAGFLYGLTHGHSPHDCGRLGSLAAAEAISHVGARPEVPYSNFLAKKAR